MTDCVDTYDPCPGTTGPYLKTQKIVMILILDRGIFAARLNITRKTVILYYHGCGRPQNMPKAGVGGIAEA